MVAQCWGGPPDVLHRPAHAACAAVLKVNPPEEHRISTKSRREQHRLRGGMSKGIELPRDAGRKVELLLQKPVAQRGLVHHCDEVRAGLVVLCPAIEHERQLTARDESLGGILPFLGLLVPPALEKCLLCEGEAPVWVDLECLHDRVERVRHAGGGKIVALAVEVLVHGLQPANIVMRVRDQVYLLPPPPIEGPCQFGL